MEKRVWLLLLASFVIVGVLSYEGDEELGDEELMLEDELKAQEDLKVMTEQVLYTPPQLNGAAYLAETFDKGLSRWQQSEAKKDGVDEAIAKYAGEWKAEESELGGVKNDIGLALKSKAKHHAIAVLLDKPFDFKTASPLIVQYEVKFQNGMECGGAYVKLLSASSDGPLNLKQFNDKSPYTIMFGPDKCGSDSKLHFILRHRNPKTGVYSEKHGKKPSSLADFYNDKQTHLFRLTVGSDSSWDVRVDNTIINAGSLLDDMEPPINPPAEVDDPNDTKPMEWDDRKKIPDPDAKKPDDWDEDEPETIVDESAKKPDDWLEDEPATIPDAAASKPTDWDDDMDGEWEAPLVPNTKCSAAAGCGPWSAPKIKNPKYKGKWRAPMIDNPEYKGVWKARLIANPDYFEEKTPYSGITPIAALGLELWSMTDGVLFDNFLITDDEAVAEAWTKTSWGIKRDVELASKAAASSSSTLESLKQLADDKPWLVVGIAAAGVAVLLLVVYTCCCGKPKLDDAARTKKTDSPTQDDVPEEDTESKKKQPASESQETGDKGDTKSEDETDQPQQAKQKSPGAAAESSEDDGRNKGGESSSAGEGKPSPTRRSARKARKDT